MTTASAGPGPAAPGQELSDARSQASRRERWQRALRMGAAVPLALLLGAVLLLLAGVDPLASYAALLDGAVGSPRALELVLVQVVPLLLIALGLCAAYRARVWNIGTEGQFQLGALGAGAFLLIVPVGSGLVAIPAAMLAGAVAAGALGWAIGYLRARWEINEVVTSLLSNYVVFFALAYVVRRPLRDQESATSLQTERIPEATVLPDLLGTRVHIGLLVALLLVPVVAWALTRTPFGMRVRLVGLNRDAAKAAGVGVRGVVVRTMVISGAFAGLAGAIEVMGSEFRLTSTISTGVGFTAIIVALLGRLSPVGVVFAAILIGGMSVGGDVMQLREGVPGAVVLAIQALIVLFVLLLSREGRLAGVPR